MQKCIVLFFLGLTLFQALAQQPGSSLTEVEQKLKSLDYPAVIELANRILQNDSTLSGSDVIRINEMRGVAYFAQNDLKNALFAFMGILELDAAHRLDPHRISPKILSFFEEVRSDFLKRKRDEELRGQTQTQPQPQPDADSLSTLIRERSFTEVRGAMIRSIFLPGWGHLHTGKRTKGWTLTLLSLAALGSGVYTSVDTRRKEDRYLNETNNSLIEARYATYNDAFHRRNATYIGSAVIWLYTQFDLFYFSHRANLTRTDNRSRRSHLLPMVSAGSDRSLRLSWQARF